MEKIQHHVYYTSPVGLLEITGNGHATSGIGFSEERHAASTPNTTPAYLAACLRQLDEYFAGNRRHFDFPLEIEGGTPFQRQVWKTLPTIPYGSVATYGDVAKQISRPKAVRAVGQANNRNRFCIVLPCHRVVGANGTMVGYAGGLWRKEWLLAHEQR